jgi:hypothetical protein
MLELGAAAQIDDTSLSQDAPYMRALLAARLEMVWQVCQPHIDGTREKDGWNPDPRFVLAGLRALQAIGKLYRLDEPAKQAPKQVAGTGPDTRALVAGYLERVEEREKERF